MALIRCGECSTEISDTASACVKCGAPIPATPRATISPYTPPPTKPVTWPWIAGSAILVGAFIFHIQSRSPPAQEDPKVTDLRAVRLCWEEQQRKSHEPSTQRFVAKACETLEARFQEKYGTRP